MEEADGRRVEVELVDQENVRPDALNDLGDVSRLPPEYVVDGRIRKMLDEQTGSAAVQRCVERGEAYVGLVVGGSRGHSGGADDERQDHGQQ